MGDQYPSSNDEEQLGAIPRNNKFRNQEEHESEDDLRRRSKNRRRWIMI
jgi:hypothetical protein